MLINAIPLRARQGCVYMRWSVSVLNFSYIRGAIHRLCLRLQPRRRDMQRPGRSGKSHDRSHDDHMTSDTQAVCSGNGMCECGECTCNSNFAGTYCQICTTTSVSYELHSTLYIDSFPPSLPPQACPVASCNDTLQCAMCLVDPTGSNCDACNETINRVTGIGSNYMISGTQGKGGRGRRK